MIYLKAPRDNHRSTTLQSTRLQTIKDVKWHPIVKRLPPDEFTSNPVAQSGQHFVDERWFLERHKEQSLRQLINTQERLYEQPFCLYAPRCSSETCLFRRRTLAPPIAFDRSICLKAESTINSTTEVPSCFQSFFPFHCQITVAKLRSSSFLATIKRHPSLPSDLFQLFLPIESGRTGTPHF